MIPNVVKMTEIDEPHQVLIIHSFEHIKGKISQQCANINFKEVSMKNPYLVKELTKTDISNYSLFHKSCDHNINECIHLKYEIEEMIKMEQIALYTQEGGRKEDQGRSKDNKEK